VARARLYLACSRRLADVSEPHRRAGIWRNVGASIAAMMIPAKKLDVGGPSIGQEHWPRGSAQLSPTLIRTGGTTMNRLLFAFLSLLALFSSSAGAQDTSITGTVYVADHGPCTARSARKPAPGVIVELWKANKQDILGQQETDSAGRFAFAPPSGASYVLLAEYAEYKAERIIHLAPSTESVDLCLERRDYATESQHNCTVPSFEDLSQETRKMILDMKVSYERWRSLSNAKRLLIFNIVGAARKAGLSLGGVEVNWVPGKGVHRDRVFLTGARPLFDQVVASTHFSDDIGKGSLHGEYSNSHRHNVFYKSMQLSFTEDPTLCEKDDERFDDARQKCISKGGLTDRLSIQFEDGGGSVSFRRPKHDGVDADIDVFNPNLRGGYGLGLILHGLEVGLAHDFSKKWGWLGLTDPYSVAFRKSNWACLEDHPGGAENGR
jgi:hypothetical protein